MDKSNSLLIPGPELEEHDGLNHPLKKGARGRQKSAGKVIGPRQGATKFIHVNADNDTGKIGPCRDRQNALYEGIPVGVPPPLKFAVEVLGISRTENLDWSL